jgi:hypothetical protein
MKAQTMRMALVGAGLLSLAVACDRKLPTSQSEMSAVSADREKSDDRENSESERGQKFRWDIISVDFATGTLSAGGVASAKADDGSKITLTGSGTFQTNHKGKVRGGGTWQTLDATGAATGSGTYHVRRLVSFALAPGTPPLPNDNIGILANNRAGLALLWIRYSDGSHGILVVSCHLVGTSDAVFEGITASKSFVDYWNREPPPAPPGNANRTTFHLLAEDED